MPGPTLRFRAKMEQLGINPCVRVSPAQAARLANDQLRRDLDAQGNEALAVPIWWSYAAAEILITAGFFFGREDTENASELV